MLVRLPIGESVFARRKNISTDTVIHSIPSDCLQHQSLLLAVEILSHRTKTLDMYLLLRADLYLRQNDVCWKRAVELLVCVEFGVGFG